jgi:hypothetical protein
MPFEERSTSADITSTMKSSASPRVVISQSMYFPWVGMLEQIRLCDTFVFYDDVQFSKGSLTNRVQVKQPDSSTSWMTVPLLNLKLGQRIDEVKVFPPETWADKHLNLLRNSFLSAPFAADALALAEEVLSKPHPTIADIARESLLVLCRYYGLDQNRRFIDSKELNIPGKGSERVLQIVKALGGRQYITGHGASNYLDHALFERSGISVRYMKYDCIPYPQLHGKFTPYLTALDLVANCGKEGASFIASESIPWREFLTMNKGT